jgi:cell division protein FtsL
MTVMVKREWIKSRRSSHLIREKAGIDWINFGRAAILLAVAFAAAFFYIWQHLQIIRSGYEIENLRRELTTLRTQNSLLAVEAASMADLRITEKRARWELGMIVPDPGQVVYGCRNGEDDGQEE